MIGNHPLNEKMAVLAAYCREHYQAEVEKTIAFGSQITEGIFCFDNPWDLESYQEPVIYKESIRWEQAPNGDPEFVWQFNRHQYFIRLGQAYALTGDEKYAVAYDRLLNDWMDNVPLDKTHETKGWRSLDAGFRGESWTKSMKYFKESPRLTDNTRTRYLEGLRTHAKYLASCHSVYKYASNWGIIENYGLYAIAQHLPDQSERDYYSGIAVEHLEVAAKMQIMEDGMHWEQSPMYHHEVLHCLLNVLVLAEKFQMEPSPILVGAVKKMAYAVLSFLKPDGCCFMNGDSDDMSMKGILGLAAWYYKDPVLKFAGGEDIGYENVWNLGMDAVKEYTRVVMERPDFCSAAFPDSGNFYLRSNWEKTGNLLHFHCGTIGAGHGHSDKLHVDLVMGGRDVLVDAGRFSYALEKGRVSFKDPDAHNTIVVDGEPFTRCVDSWECDKLSQPVNRSFKLREKYEFTEGGHLGYIEKGIFINRKIIYMKPDIYLIADEIYGNGEHCYESYFHFSEKGKTSLSGRKVSYEDESGKVYLYSLDPDAGIAIFETEISRHYNMKEKNSCVKITKTNIGFTSFFTIVSGGSLHTEKVKVKSALKGITYEENKAEAVRIMCPDEEYVVIICHKEVNSPTDLVEAGGYTGMGNVIVFSKSAGKLNGTVLHW